MQKIKILMAAAALVLAACNNQPQQAGKTDSAQSLEDKLYKDVLALHDEAMPKMGKLMGYQKNIQAKIDSLGVILSKKKDAGAAAAKAGYETLLAKLKAAEQGMNEWMDGFNPDPKLPSQEATIQYFKEQKEKAAKMKTDMFSALDSAKAKLGL